MAENASHTDADEATKPGGTRKQRSIEKLPTLIGGAQERGLPAGAARESPTGGLAATWNASQAGVERGAALLPGWLRRLGYYGLALLFVAVAAMLRWALGDILSPTPFLIFYLAWVGAAVFGGLGPGLLATVASWLCVDLLFDTTPGQVGLADPASVGRLLILLAGGLGVSVVAEKLRRSRIHERRQARKLTELAQSLEREKGILQSVMSGAKNSHLVYLDRDFNFVCVNEAYAKTCGYTPEEMVGKNHFALYPHAENEALFSRVRDTGVPVEVHDKPFAFPDQPERGTTYWDWTLTPVKNDSGYVEGLVFSLFETTQRKQAEEALRNANDRLQQQAEELQTQTEELQAQAEELTTANEELRDSEQALRESEERYRKFFTDDLAGDFIATADGRIVECNPAFADIYGLSSAAEAVRYNLRSFNSRDWTDLVARLKEECVIRTHQCIHRRPDGQEIHVVANVVGHFDEAAELTAIKGYVYDDTERKQAEEALRELNATLESKVAQRTAELEHRARQLQKLTLDLSEAEDRERKRLAEILHDDLQQTLAAAKFHLGLMSNRCKNDKTLQETTKRVEQLLVEAIGKSRSLSHELRPPGLAQSDLRETFEWLASQVQAKHGLTVHLDVRDRLGLRTEPIKTLLYKAAQEMLFNVVKHAQVREARLRLRRRRGNICLAVSDKGRGFDPQGLGSSAGSGLLNIRERVNLLGGRMKVRSARGKGSTFLIVLPDPPQQTGQTDHL